MPNFTGSNQEFKRYFGPRLRNLVQQITDKHKRSVGACEHCGVSENLQAAHLRGRGRNQIIDRLIGTTLSDDVVTIDLEQFEKDFRSEHDPVEKAILILCRECHTRYDSASAALPSGKATTARPKSTLRGQGAILPITLNPAQAVAFKAQLLTHRKAVITIYYGDGRSERRLWDAPRFSESSNVLRNLRSRPEFRQGHWQSQGIVKVHVSVGNA